MGNSTLNRVVFSLACSFTVALFTPIQAFAWKKPTQEELAMSAPEWCPDADAMVLKKSADCKVSFTGDGFLLREDHTVRIKIFTRDGFDWASLPTIVPNGYKLEEIDARTVGPDGKSSKVKRSEIFLKKIYSGEDGSRMIRVYNMAFPDVTEGSILEVSYQLYTKSIVFVPPYYLDIEGLPVAESSLKFTIPGWITYMTSGVNMDKYGFQDSIEKFPSLEGDIIQYSATAKKILIDTDIQNPPESGLLRPVVYFVFARIDHPLVRKEVVPDWKAAVKILINYYDDYTEEGNPAKSVGSLAALAYPDKPAHEAVFRFVTDQINWSGSRSCFEVDATTDRVLKDRKGNGIEKALLLNQSLNGIGVESDIVLTVPSTSGRTMTRLPAMTQFETYVVRAKVDNKAVFLDPTKPGTPFGTIPWYLSGSWGLICDEEEPNMIPIANPNDLSAMNWTFKGAIDSNGKISMDGTLILQDQFFVSQSVALHDVNKEKLSSAIQLYAGWNESHKIDTTSMSVQSDDSGSATISFRVSITEPIERVEDEFLLRPRPLSFFKSNEFTETKREVPICFSFPRTVTASSELTLPPGYVFKDVGERTKKTTLNCLEFKQDVVTTLDSSVVMCKQKYSRTKTEMSAGSYPELQKFWRESEQVQDKMYVIGKK